MLHQALKYMKETYLPFWYNHTLPIRSCKADEVAEEFRISEKLIQALWNEPKYLPQNLIDHHGHQVKVISRGTWNREPGPDFRKAQVEIDGQLKYGDIEIHLLPEYWNSHGHQYDPNFKNVVLHVVWENIHNRHIPPNIPLLELKEQLTIPLDKIYSLIQFTNYSKSRMHPTVDCSESISQISDDQLTLIFRAAGLSRLQRKCAHFKLNVLKYGFEQAFFLGLADAHGFKNNRLPFRKLAQLANIEKLQELPNDTNREALLWGMSNLLPDCTQERILPELHLKNQQLWQHWGLLRENATENIQWSHCSQRPLNSPERRLAALICFLEKCQYKIQPFLEEAQTLLASPKCLRKFISSFFDFTSPWENYCNYHTSLKKPCKLLGAARQLDIIVNVFIPALASLNKDNEVETEDLYYFYCSLPKCQDNHSLDIARHRFFIPPARMKRIIQKAVDQQGLIQLLQDYDLPNTDNDIISFWNELGIPIKAAS